ncbi:hypothetical protein Noca_4773 (plasmid) [Nocardioides sp. JS614]|nr:hypothetical protein Noca_4773 [Nocardioides sp. JS614]
MAGGGYGRGSGIPLKDRVRVGGHQERAVQPSPSADPQAPPPSIKHCWVTDRHGQLPALLIGWRQVEGSWSGRVVRAVRDPDGNWLVVEEWLPAELLTSA